MGVMTGMRTSMIVVSSTIIVALGAGSWAQRFATGGTGLKVGDKAPDFTLKALGSGEQFKLSDNFGKKPTVLVFGSYT